MRDNQQRRQNTRSLCTLFIQCVSPIDALRTTTINAAHQNFKEKERGPIELEKWAALVVLSANPVTVVPMSIKVLKTVAAGKAVYQAPRCARDGVQAPVRGCLPIFPGPMLSVLRSPCAPGVMPFQLFISGSTPYVNCFKSAKL